MAKLYYSQDLSPDAFIDLVRSNPIMVYENIQGSKIYVQRKGDSFVFRPKSIRGENLSAIDLTLQKYYTPLVEFFNNMDESKKYLIPSGWWMEFEWFFDEKPGILEYDMRPKNGLILTSIIKGKKRIFDVDEINEYAGLLEVEPIPILFFGQLDNHQIEGLKTFLETNPDDLDFLFGEENFSKWFYHLLNPNVKNSLLMQTGHFAENIDKMIIKIGGKKEVNFSLLNPMHPHHSNKEGESFTETYSIIILDFLQHIQDFDFDNAIFESETRWGMYLELICQLYNYWILESGSKFEYFDFPVPQFFQFDKFKVNTDLLNNEKTLELLQQDDRYEWAFRCILSSFQKERNKTIGLLNENSLKFFNKAVGTIHETIDNKMDFISYQQVHDKGLMDFTDFDILQKALDGMPPSDMYQELETSMGGKKKPGKITKK